MKKFSLLLGCVICLLLLSGCWDKSELEDSTFTVLLGIDKADDQDIIITVAFPLTQTQGGGANEGMNNGSGDYTVMSVKAATVVEGLNMLSTKLSGPLALYSVKTIVIAQELAENDMMRHVFSSWRYKEIRNTTNVLISECKAAEFIEARINASPIDPLRQEELLLEQINDSAYYKPVQLLELLTSLKSDSADGIAMYGGLIKESLPGEIPIKAENKSQVSGLAVFHDAKIVGVLNSSEAQTYAMLTQSKTKKILTIPDPLDPESDIVVSILPAGKNKINSSINYDIPVFNIDIKLICTVECIQSEIDYTSFENYNILTEYIKQNCVEKMSDLIAKTQKEYNADILKLGDKLAYNFRTVSEWESYNWSEKYKDAEINLNVNLEIEQTGIMIP